MFFAIAFITPFFLGWIDPRDFYSAASGIKDVSLAFEGEFAKLEKGDWVPNTVSHFVGQGGFHSDGIVFLEWQTPTESGPLFQRLSLRQSGFFRKETRPPDTPATQMESQRGSTVSLAGNTESFAMLWPTALFYAIPDRSRTEWKDEGDQVLDGINCRVFSWTTGRNIWRFWIDPLKGGNAIRFDKMVEGKLRQRTDRYGFVQVAGKDGKKYFAPTSAVSESFFDPRAPKGSQIRETPVTRTNYRIAPSTIIVNSGRSADSFEVKPKKDALRKDLDAKPQAPPTDVPSNGKSPPVRPINDPSDAAEKKRELLAGTKYRPSVDWSSPLSWALAGAGVAVICVGLFLHRRST